MYVKVEKCRWLKLLVWRRSRAKPDFAILSTLLELSKHQTPTFVPSSFNARSVISIVLRDANLSHRLTETRYTGTILSSINLRLKRIVTATYRAAFW